MSSFVNYHYPRGGTQLINNLGTLQNSNYNKERKKKSNFFHSDTNSVEAISGPAKTPIPYQSSYKYNSYNNYNLQSNNSTLSNKDNYSDIYYNKNNIYSSNYNNYGLSSNQSYKKDLSNSVRIQNDDLYGKYYDNNNNNNYGLSSKQSKKKELSNSVKIQYDDLYGKYYDNYNDTRKQLYNNNNDTNDNSFNNNRNLNSIISSTVGLTNLGNTCFMNTSLQILIHSEDFIKRLLKKEPKSKISQSFFSLCKSMASSFSSISPSEFKDRFGFSHKLFRGYGQNDTQEFCRVLLEDMNKELNEVKHKAPYKELKTSNKSKITCDREYDELFRSRESSIVMDSFYGQIINTFTCKCGMRSYSFQKVLDLPLLLNRSNIGISINELLSDYFQEEKIKFETKCEQCRNKTTHIRETKFSQPPNILILSLQRINWRTQRKNNCMVQFSEKLNIKEYIDEECGHGNEYNYSLYAIGNHSGTINFGHYYAYIKLNDKVWYEFNDSHVSKIGNINTSSTNVYTLFYKKNM